MSHTCLTSINRLAFKESTLLALADDLGICRELSLEHNGQPFPNYTLDELKALLPPELEDALHFYPRVVAMSAEVARNEAFAKAFQILRQEKALASLLALGWPNTSLQNSSIERRDHCMSVARAVVEQSTGANNTRKEDAQPLDDHTMSITLAEVMERSFINPERVCELIQHELPKNNEEVLPHFVKVLWTKMQNSQMTSSTISDTAVRMAHLVIAGGGNADAAHLEKNGLDVLSGY